MDERPKARGQAKALARGTSTNVHLPSAIAEQERDGPGPGGREVRQRRTGEGLRGERQKNKRANWCRETLLFETHVISI